MEIFIARQPILNRDLEVCAYELLHRNNKEKNFSLTNSDQATLGVINSFVEIGMEDLSDGKPCFINFTDTLLEKEIPSYFNPDTIVIEILETVKITDEIIDICQRLKFQGYKIALDDFEWVDNEENYRTIMNLVDIVKIDIRNTSREQQINMLKLLKPFHVDLLAEKVETRQEYEQCLADGYKYFQGYFFCKPVILSTRDVHIQNNNFFQIIGELSKPEPNYDKIAEIIERDVSISYKILKLINSPALRRVREIKSIKQAVVMLGFKELKKWFCLMYIHEPLVRRNPIQNEITKMSMTRAKICELIAASTGKKADGSSYFLMGLFSLIDTLLNQPLNKIINQLPLDQLIKDTLLGFNTSYRDILDLAIFLEKGEWMKIVELCNRIGIKEENLFHLYLNAMKWTQEVLSEVELPKREGTLYN